ncbi:MAG: helix-hairpin-helix domain-containing protein [Armatimonadota bacterium]
MTARSGVILVVVLWVLVILAAVALAFAHTVRVDVRSAHNEARGSEAYFAAVSGLERAIIELASDTNAYDGVDETWMYIESAQEGLLPDEDLSYEVSVLDECSKLNVNTADKDALMQLPGMEEAVADAILDWRDADSDVRPQGAEEEYYQTLTPPYHCANAPFRTVHELLLVKGMDPVLLYGDQQPDERLSPAQARIVEGPKTNQSQRGAPQPWVDLLTVYSLAKEEASDGQMRLDVNQATAEQIAERMGADLGEGDAQAIVQARQQRSGNTFGSIGDVWDVLAGRTGETQQLRAKMAAVADRLTARPSEQAGGPGATAGAAGGAESGGERPATGPSGGPGSGGIPTPPGAGGPGGGGLASPRTTLAPSPPGWAGDTPAPLVIFNAQLLAQRPPTGPGAPSPPGGFPPAPSTGATPPGQPGEQPEEQPPSEAGPPPLAEEPVAGLINVNTAPPEVLATLPDITDEVVEAIVSRRESEPFATRGDILNIEQVNEGVFKAIIDHITVSSSSYTIYALGRIQESGIAAHVTAVLDTSGDAPAIRYFRQDN